MPNTEKPARRRITAKISLEETDGSGAYPTWDDLVDTSIQIVLPVPNPKALPNYLADQIAGFLDLAQVRPDLRPDLRLVVDPDADFLDEDKSDGSDDD